jgi:hypothetical protein
MSTFSFQLSTGSISLGINSTFPVNAPALKTSVMIARELNLVSPTKVRAFDALVISKKLSVPDIKALFKGASQSNIVKAVDLLLQQAAKPNAAKNADQVKSELIQLRSCLPAAAHVIDTLLMANDNAGKNTSSKVVPFTTVIQERRKGSCNMSVVATNSADIPTDAGAAAFLKLTGLSLPPRTDVVVTVVNGKGSGNATVKVADGLPGPPRVSTAPWGIALQETFPRSEKRIFTGSCDGVRANNAETTIPNTRGHTFRVKQNSVGAIPRPDLRVVTPPTSNQR